VGAIQVRQCDDRTKLPRLLRLPQTLMDELTDKAMVLAREAAYRGREAVAIGIPCRIPLRIKNEHAIRIGTNLLFTGGTPTSSPSALPRMRQKTGSISSSMSAPGCTPCCGPTSTTFCRSLLPIQQILPKTNGYFHQAVVARDHSQLTGSARL
jgi:hypothetical protein